VLDRIEIDGSRPAELAYSASTGKLWVLSQPWNYADSSIAVIDTETGIAQENVVDTADSFDGTFVDQFWIIDSWIGDIVTSPDGEFVFISGVDADDADGGALLVFDAESADYLGSVPLTHEEPMGMTTRSVPNLLYVATTDGTDSYIETIDLEATDWETAAIETSAALEWPGVEACDSQVSIDYDSNSNAVFAACFDADGFATYDLDTDTMSSTAIAFDSTSVIGLDVSDDGTRIALGTCYDGSMWAELNADFSVSNVVHDLDHPNDTSKAVKFFGDGSRYASGSWEDGEVYVFDGGDGSPAARPLVGPGSNPTSMSGVYVSSIALTDEYSLGLADTGFESAPLIGFAVVAIGCGIIAARRRRAV
jgi:WD40 repeat protein